MASSFMVWTLIIFFALLVMFFPRILSLANALYEKVYPPELAGRYRRYTLTQMKEVKSELEDNLQEKNEKQTREKNV
ncbi:hypothetical protein HYW21_08665 [Candidatus Woesearchaeota archaeon]|nr:hypothetical protein [Candidatus Woesearchaeota archaeon]